MLGEEPEVCSKVSERVKMAGFLDKKGSMLWKRYWFVLEDRLLLYYKSQVEYLNLSPCRGSLNMGLVSCVQPRRNSKDPVIHLVTRSNTIFLRAKNRESQEKWLQSLLESIGRQGTASLRFSLDDLPGEVQAMTLPRRFHTGSLDAVWKPTPVIPKSKMLDRVLGYDEADENQNTPYDKDMKSLTLDSRRVDSKFNKLRNALAKRKTSAIIEPELAMSKTRRESFLTKMFKKSPTKIAKDIEVQDSDADDPLYDKIDHSKVSETPQPQKQLFGTKILLPEGTMTELKNKLRSKDSLVGESFDEDKNGNIVPPELPPRGPSNSMSALNDETTVAVVHSAAGDEIIKPEVEDSEDSEVSGHYNVIHREKPVEKNEAIEVPAAEKEEKKVVEEVQYQVIDKDKKKKKKIEVEVVNELRIVEPLGIEEHANKLIDELEEKNLTSLVDENSNETETGEDPNRYVVHIVVEGKTQEEKTLEVLEKKIEENYDIPKITLDDASKKESTVDVGSIDSGLSDLNSLLQRLVEITTAPLSSREGQSSWTGVEKATEPIKLQRCHSEPDYDVPRPHIPVVLDFVDDFDRLNATQFFNKADESSSSSSTNSLEPDSLEAKREDAVVSG